MMFTLLFLFIILCSIKPFFYLSSLFIMTYYELFICSISFILMVVLINMSFNYYSSFNSNVYTMLFFSVFSSINLSFSVSNIYLFILFFEASLFPMIILIMNFSFDKEKLISSMFMFIMNIFGSIPYIISAYYLIYTFGSMSLDYMMMGLPLAFLSFFMFLSSMTIFLMKIPLFMLHFWLPKAHVSASGSCSMVLASLLLKMGSMGIYKFYNFYVPIYGIMYIVFCTLMSLSLIFLSLLMIRYTDLKSLVALSSVMHMSPLTYMIFIMSGISIYSSFILMVGHGIISSALFYILSVIYEQTFSRSMIFSKGYDKVNKSLIFFFIFLMLLNLGFPPFISFFSEFILASCMVSYSSYSVIFFCFYMMFCNVIFMFFTTKFLISKPNNMMFFDLNLSLIFYNSLMIFWLFSIFIMV